MLAADARSDGFIPLVSGALTRKSRVLVSCRDNVNGRWPDYNQRMANGGTNYLRAWREFRKLTQEQLAEKVDTAKAVISLLENGKRPLSDKWLRRLGEVLNVRPGHLLDVDPNEMNADIIDIWARIPEGSKDQARKVLRSFTGTDG